MSVWKIEYEAKQAHSAIDDLVKTAKEADEALLAIVGVKATPLLKYKWNLYNVDHYPSTDAARKEYTSQFEECKKVHEQNIKIVESNKKTLEGLMKLFSNMGIPKEYIDYNTRSRKTRSYHWPGEIASFFPTHDSWSSIETDYARYMAKANEKDEARKREAAQKEIDRKQKEQERINVQVIVEMALKYGIEVPSDEYEILEKILSQNKYLHLAHYMAENRGDWSEGCDLTSSALSSFKIETDMDQEIYDNVHEHVVDWCGDGRVFRDIEWNYDRLFAMVKTSDPVLFEDYEKINTIVRGW